jgi:hypothetical protein
VDVLPGFEHLDPDSSMDLVRRQVNDDLHVGIGEQVLDEACFGYAILLGPSLRSVEANVRYSYDIERTELFRVFEIDPTDCTGTNDANLSWAR